MSASVGMILAGVTLVAVTLTLAEVGTGATVVFRALAPALLAPWMSSSQVRSPQPGTVRSSSRVRACRSWTVFSPRTLQTFRAREESEILARACWCLRLRVLLTGALP